MGNNLIPPSGGDDHVETVDLKSALEERYLAYALSTIMHRALPDVRDGLKPVHRRIMHAMRLLRLNPGSAYAKCARIVGDVMGKFHPHGDASIYDALARLAQDFAVRYPLVDGQGNFGNIDGDNPAAMRYTEARMTEVASLLLEGITENAIDFRPTYNEEDEEPVVLPGAFPNLLANGSSGIAVGMATNIPPHNVAELCDAALLLIRNPQATVEELVQIVQGPDLPTGGVLVEPKENILEAYRTGRGAFRVRAKWEKEDLGRGTWVVVITEIPYQVQKSRLIEKIAELLLAKKLPLLDDIRDESAEDIRIVLEPKNRSVDPELLMESLFKLTELESRISLNMNVLSHGKVPNVLSLGGVLKEWLEHRKEVLQRRSQFRLNEIEKRLEILGGYLIAYLNLDEVIRIIREEDEPKQELMRTFSLTDMQAESILNMRLRSLRKLEEFEIRKEFDGLTLEKAQLEELLGSEIKQWKAISGEIKKVRETYGPETPLGKRRTQFAEAPSHDLEDIHQAMIEREPVTIVVSEKGWMRAMKGHLADFSSLSFKEGDKLHLAFHAETTDKIVVATTGGKFFTIGANTLPGGRGHGEPIRIMVDMDNDQDILTAFVHDASAKLLLASHEGYGFMISESEVIANTRKGKQIMNVKLPDEMKICQRVTGDTMAVVGENRKMLVFPLSELPELARGKGVRLQKYKDGGVSDIRSFAIEQGLTWQDSADRTFTRSKEELLEWTGARASAGRMVPKGFPRTGKFTS
ncbi:DNA topoisomerase IV subunit A [Pseudochrobactrum algeriensis]|uniref:DNA topoisomerase IV subunit A n=1 Tax=Pseudochrobactrum TaxID=354349 RepID=UPI0003B48FE4|nr:MULTISPECIES: DNA topoisomerase IV subunit A [Pseudochrobactrum]MBX8813377.1 DNA topoisomerase IV subunit A [Ochrobactrum sp. MR34]KAB0539894.1 DNA topoisomerase IV subunit A [Pseudochrobactrum saccharolyticum]MDP8251236.1 DNA topoisomerase IV subunit A [Pseudochrobactrum saccharolyticum]QVQ37815.1 DNA topoisomerase IV subunit A [Pseudochrobactrum algeriensis]QVQ41036.1 DNA topoisomerase IV subunit A [Pseudochrobactrum algeriensis]